MPKTNHKFQENEKVFCYHGPLLYEAKIQKIKEDKDSKDPKEKIIQYMVHYLGWSKSWDEWVPEDRVCKINETSLQKQKELTEAQSKSNKNKSAKKKVSEVKEVVTPVVALGSDKPKVKVSNVSNVNVVPPINSELKDNSNVIKDSAESQRKKRIKLETSLEIADPTVTKGSNISIQIPNLLKQALVDDWEQINQKKLVRVPSKVCVNRIVDDYLKLRLNQKFTPSKESAIREAAQGIKEYFNASLATKLLYSFEKIQYKELIKGTDDDPKPVTIYGGIHLLRLFVKLGELLSYINLDERSVFLILGHMQHFLKYLEQNPSLFTSNDYELASNDYLKKLSQI